MVLPPTDYGQSRSVTVLKAQERGYTVERNTVVRSTVTNAISDRHGHTPLGGSGCPGAGMT
jgi:hypothetical protein